VTRSLRSKRLAIVAGALSLFVLAAVAHATVVVPLTREQLVAQSDLVVRATVESHTTAWNQEHTHIVTLTRIAVREYIKGSGPGDLVLRQFGGTVGGLTEHVPGDGRLAQGQDVVLFLRRGDGVVYLTALAQSVFFVAAASGGQTTVARDLSQLTFAHFDASGRMTLGPPALELIETLDQLAQSVRASAGGAR
jgi:hypothetical protein